MTIFGLSLIRVYFNGYHKTPVCPGEVRELEETVFKASTRDVSPAEKIDYWSEVMGGIWGNINVEPTDHRTFDGRISSIKCYQLVFNEIQFRGQNLHRTPSNIARMKQGFYVLAFPRGNPWPMTQNFSDFTLQTGNAYLLSNTVPFKSHDKKGYDTFNVMIPSQILEGLIPYLEPRYIFPLTHNNQKANVLGDFVRTVYNSLPFGVEDDARFMENSLLNMLAFVLCGSSDAIEADDSSVKLAHRRRVQDFITKNLSDEFMSPESIALAHGISVSYLHRIFKPTGRTVMETMRNQRLKRAKSILRDASMAGLSVTEIAYHLGFKHPSDFSRAFKSKFGLTPKEARQLAQNC